MIHNAYHTSNMTGNDGEQLATAEGTKLYQDHNKSKTDKNVDKRRKTDMTTDDRKRCDTNTAGMYNA